MTVTATTTKTFLETREALCLCANVSAHVYPQGEASPGRARLVPCRTENSSAKKVSVGSVLREIEETNQKRKRRLLLRKQRHRRRRRRGDQASRSSRRQQRSSGTDTDGVAADNDLADEEHPLEELDNGDEAELRDHSADGGWPPLPHRSKSSAGSSLESHDVRGRNDSTVTGPRLALGASVSILSGLLGTSPMQRGECDTRISVPIAACGFPFRS